MKKLLVIVAFACTSCGTTEPRSWDFVQSVGGIQVGTPLISEVGGWVLPVVADVSGTKKVTVAPTTNNSGLVCDTKASVEGQAIYVTVSTALPEGTRTASCPFAGLGKIPYGTYSVLYRGPNWAPVFWGMLRLRNSPRRVA